MRAVAILTPFELEGRMRAYLTVIEMALGLMAVWAALVAVRRLMALLHHLDMTAVSPATAVRARSV